MSSPTERFFAPEIEYMLTGTPVGVVSPISADCQLRFHGLASIASRRLIFGFCGAGSSPF
jgi:hypothetical protein